MNWVRVLMTWDEIGFACTVGQRRAMHALRNHWERKHGNPSEFGGLQEHVNGAVGEMALAKYTNTYWPPAIGEYGGIDVGGKYQVRAIDKSNYSLILHDEDKDDQPFVLALVLGSALPMVTLLGWTPAKVGKLKDYWRTDVRGPAYFAPQSILRPMIELPPPDQRYAASLVTA